MLQKLKDKAIRRRNEDRRIRRKRLNIAFDIDGVVVDVHTVFSKILLARYGIDTFYPKQHDVTVGTQLTREQLWGAIREAYLKTDETPIYDGSKELMSVLHNLSGDKITFITARPPEFEKETRAVMDRFCHVPYNVIFCKGSDKILHLRGFDYFVDDRRKTARQLAEHGKKVFMPTRSYNKLTKSDSDCIIEIQGVSSLINFAEFYWDEWIKPKFQ